MKNFDSGRVQDGLIKQLERQEKQKAYRQDRFFKFKLTEIHNRLTQALLMQGIVESDNPAAVSDSVLKGLKRILKSNEFDFRYFIAPIRNLVPRPNPYALYMTQYLTEVLVNEPGIIEVYGTDSDIYRVINEVLTQINIKFERAEAEVVEQLSHNKALIAGSREYDVAMDELFRKKVGEPQKV